MLDDSLIRLETELKNQASAESSQWAGRVYYLISQIHFEIPRRMPSKGDVSMRIIPLLEQARKALAPVYGIYKNPPVNITEFIHELRRYSLEGVMYKPSARKRVKLPL